MRRETLFGLLAGLLIATGCGGLSNPDQPDKSLVTLKGEVTNAAQVSAKGAVRMALVWSNAPMEKDNTFAVSQDIPMTTQFPAAFSLQINGLPPKSMVMTKQDLPADERDELPDGFGFAVGGLVVYADDNGNGKLDLIGAGDQAVDRILGADDELLMFYFEGTLPPPLVPPDKLDGSFQLGYNLLRLPDCLVSAPAESTGTSEPGGNPAPTCADKAKVYPVNNGAIGGVVIPLTQDPKLSGWMCKSGLGDSVGSGTINIAGPASAPYPAADDPHLSCSGDGQSYILQTCTEITNGPCTGTEISCTGNQYSMPDPANPPVDWPCPVGAGSSGSGSGGTPDPPPPPAP